MHELRSIHSHCLVEHELHDIRISIQACIRASDRLSIDGPGPSMTDSDEGSVRILGPFFLSIFYNITGITGMMHSILDITSNRDIRGAQYPHIANVAPLF
jgi:hypothetical protein